jgi:hypothetical protein
MHNLKTGALISGCFSGPGILKDLTSDQQRQIKSIGLEVGFLFQAKDDILDAHEKNQESKSIIPLLGNLKTAQDFIEQRSEAVIRQLNSFLKQLEVNFNHENQLITFINWNRQRTH